MKGKNFHCNGTCNKIFRNKCCIVCLILLGMLAFFVVGAKIFINTLLNEIEEESLQSNVTLSGLINERLEEYENGNGNGSRRTWTLMERLTTPPEILGEFPHTFAGYDYMNQPVWIVPFGIWDVKRVLNARDENGKIMKDFTDLAVQRVIECVTGGKNATKLVGIVDMKDYSYTQLASYKSIAFQLKVALKFLTLADYLDYGIAVNMDYFSEVFVNMMRPLGGVILDKFEFFGRDSAEFKEAILKKIPPSQVPSQYGGSSDYKPVREFY